MNSNRAIHFSGFLILTLVLGGLGCRTHKPPKPIEPPPPITTIRIGKFQCDNAVTAEAVRNVFIEVFGRNHFVKLVREGEAEVVIEGTVTYAEAGSSMSRLGAGPNWAAGKSQATGGEYVSGVTSIAYRNGEIFTSASWGQVMAKGGEILPPELVARKTADKLQASLYPRGQRGGLKTQ